MTTLVKKKCKSAQFALKTLLVYWKALTLKMFFLPV